MVKALQKPSFMIICSFVLGYLGLVLPVTRIQYQVITKSLSSTGEQTLVSSQRFSSMLGDRYGQDPLRLCISGFAVSNSSSNISRLYSFWNFLGRGLTIVVFSSWMSYVVQRKVPLVKFASLLVLFFSISIAGTILLSPEEPMCDPNVQYLLISYVPFWPTLVLLIGGILFGYRASHLMKTLDSSVSATSNVHP